MEKVNPLKQEKKKSIQFLPAPVLSLDIVYGFAFKHMHISIFLPRSSTVGVGSTLTVTQQ